MNLDEKENYRLDGQNFQDDATRYEGNSVDSPNLEHPFTDNAEPDYADDLVNTESSSEKSGNDEFGNDQFDNENLGNEDLDNEGMGDIDDEEESFSTDEEGTDPNRNL